MSENIPKENIYYLFSNGQSAVAVNQSLDFIGQDETLEQLATPLGLNGFVWPDGKGFALNFDNVVGIHEIHVASDERNGELVTKLVPKPLLSNGSVSLLPGMSWNGEGTGIQFKNAMLLFVPVAREDVEHLRTESVDNHNSVTPSRPKFRMPYGRAQTPDGFTIV